MKSSEYDRLGDLQRIQKREYERIIVEFAHEHSVPRGASYSIYTDRSTMERKNPRDNQTTIKGRPVL